MSLEDERKAQWRIVLALVAPVLVRVGLAAIVLVVVQLGLLPAGVLDECLAGLVDLRP